MNEELNNWIWNHSKVQTGGEVLVLLALAHKANVFGECTIKLAELAKMTRLKEDLVRVALRKAVQIKELAIFENHAEDGRRLTNTYQFTVMKAKELNGEDDIQFDDPALPGIAPLPGIPPPKVKDLPRPAQPKIMMDAAQLDMIAADPIYKGLDVRAQAWKFKRWCKAQVPPAEETVRRFKVWLSRV